MTDNGCNINLIHFIANNDTSRYAKKNDINDKIFGLYTGKERMLSQGNVYLSFRMGLNIMLDLVKIININH